MGIICIVVRLNVEDAKVFRNFFRDVELYVINPLTVLNIHVPKTLYIVCIRNWAHEIYIYPNII